MARRPANHLHSHTVIPRFAIWFGGRVGLDTDDVFERRLGPGAIGIGMHPNSADDWRLPRSHWHLGMDGWGYGASGDAIAETAAISAPARARRDRNWYPVARCDWDRAGILGVLALRGPGPASLQQAIKLLGKPSAVSSTRGERDFYWRARGYAALEGRHPFRAWQLVISFVRGAMTGIEVDAFHSWAEMVSTK